MKTQKICTSILIIIICSVSFFIGYTDSFSLPVYADSDLPSGYTPANSDTDLASSFNDYVKSRNANFNGSLPDAANLYILNLMNKGAQNLNTNLDTIKSKIAKKSDTGGRIIWYFDSTVTNFYNSLFDFLLQDLDLSVGDIANEEVYSGYLFTDDNNNSSLCYVISSATTSGTGYNGQPLSFVKQKGTKFVYDGVDLNNNSVSNLTFVKNGSSYTFNIYRYNNMISLVSSSNGSSDTAIYSSIQPNGTLAIFYSEYEKKFYFGSIGLYKYSEHSSYYGGRIYPNNILMGSTGKQPATVNLVSIDNKTINNNNYEGDTYITNEGDLVNEGDTNINYNPYPDGGGSSTGSGTTGGSGTDGTINFPDINFSLPDINWSLGDLSQKFPFSIPFDLVSFFTLINAEPEAPRIDAEIPLGTWYTWEFEADFGQFENYAAIVRNVEFIGFCVGLIYITIRLVKG